MLEIEANLDTKLKIIKKKKKKKKKDLYNRNTTLKLQDTLSKLQLYKISIL